jgi:transcriptional regulator with XRE-family HTH domain
LPFTDLRLAGRRPREFPRGYPHAPATLGQRIKQRRLNRGLSQRIVAVRLGCELEAIALWERDACVPLAGRWPAIEALLGTGLVPETACPASRLKAARLRAGLTQAALAGLAGLDLRTVRNAERGHHCPSRITALKLGRVLHPAGDPEPE